MNSEISEYELLNMNENDQNQTSKLMLKYDIDP